MIQLLDVARTSGYAVGAFNVYNLEGAKAVIGAAELERSPVILQVHPEALDHGGRPLLALCLSAAQDASVPAALHLDHCISISMIENALEMGVASVMADGSHLSYEENVAFSIQAVRLAQAYGASVEAELGRLSGTEDGLSVAERDALLTDPASAARFVSETGIHALAVCIGNVHGSYQGEPRLDFQRLQAIQARVAVPLVLHGASGLPDVMICRSIALGVTKFNVNTEIRAAYVAALRAALTNDEHHELLDLAAGAENAMQSAVATKLRLFGSSQHA